MGNGYIDTIVNPDHVENFVSRVKDGGFTIEGLTWWEYCKTRISEAKIGVGGSKSPFLPGWLAEVPMSSIDRIEETKSTAAVVEAIEKKEFTYQGRVLLRYTGNALWSGFWIRVPETWRNDGWK